MTRPGIESRSPGPLVKLILTLVGCWFYGMSTLVGLFYSEVSLFCNYMTSSNYFYLTTTTTTTIIMIIKTMEHEGDGDTTCN